MTAVEAPHGWTVTHEQRPASQFDSDPDSAFKDGMHWVVRDPDGERPPASEWPTDWEQQAVRYAHSVAARAAAQATDERSPLRGPSPMPSDRAVAVERPDPVAPQDWDGPPHLRPGLYRRGGAA